MTECVECERRGCPTEGMTMSCPECHDVVCAGHVSAHYIARGHPVPPLGINDSAAPGGRA